MLSASDVAWSKKRAKHAKIQNVQRIFVHTTALYVPCTMERLKRKELFTATNVESVALDLQRRPSTVTLVVVV